MGNLNKVQYTDHQTVITADNLNNIQDAVIQNTSYTTCSTGASTAAKTASLTNFVLTTGSAVKVKFTNTNTAANPTLNVNSTGAKPIMQYGTTVAGTTATESWDDGAVVEFVYDGTNWVMQGRNTIDAVSKANGGTFDNNVSIIKPSTTTSDTGWCGLVLGNSTPTGTVGASMGHIEMYGRGAYKHNIMSAYTMTADRDIVFPDKGGTLMTDQGGTFSGDVNIVKPNSGTGTAISKLTIGNNIDYGTVGNTYGALEIYSGHTQKATIYAGNPTADRELTCPDISGVINVTASINGSDGYSSQASITAVRNYVDALADNATAYALLRAGDVGALTILKANSNYATVVRTSYNGPSYNAPVIMHSMQKYGGTWGPWVQIMGGAGATASYTPSITAPSVTGFSVDNITFLYKLTSEFLWLSGRFRVVNHGTGDNYINISYPTGVKTITGVGSFGTVHVTNSLNSSALSIRPSNDGTYCFIQSGAGNTSVSSIIPNGYYVIIQAMIPLR